MPLAQMMIRLGFGGSSMQRHIMLVTPSIAPNELTSYYVVPSHIDFSPRPRTFAPHMTRELPDIMSAKFSDILTPSSLVRI